jgi:hypothetical protein
MPYRLRVDLWAAVFKHRAKKEVEKLVALQVSSKTVLHMHDETRRFRLRHELLAAGFLFTASIVLVQSVAAMVPRLA